MASFKRADYRPTNARVRLAENNAANGWPATEKWPDGVPAEKLTWITIPGGTRVQLRKVLAPLAATLYELSDVKYKRRFTRGWTGGYDNRAIAGTSTASNHSKGRALDNDAQDNPQTSPENFTSNMPPDLVDDWESCGWAWGGRYTGRPDPMHFEYVGTPDEVAGDLDRARALLLAAKLRENPSDTEAIVASLPESFVMHCTDKDRPLVFVKGNGWSQFPEGPGYGKAREGFKKLGYEELYTVTAETFDVILRAVENGAHK